MLSRIFISLVAFLLVVQCNAANYYFAANGSDSYTTIQAQSKSTPWQTINKLNTFFPSLKAGDSVLFRCGDTFTGTIVMTASGAAGNPIVLASYGTGAKPTISGLVPVTGWTSLGGNIYQGSCPGAGANVNVVVMNGALQPMGRWPNANTANAGYLNVDSHVGDTQITSAALNTAVNWAGAEVVIRKNHWILDRGVISSNTTTVINYTDVSSYQPTNNFGFFIQNSPNTLDQQGEWYFNPSNKTLQVYSTAAPTNTSLQVSGLTSLVTVSSKNFITVNGLAFLGANNYIFNINNCSGFQIKNCTLGYCGITGILANVTNNFVVDHTSIKNMASNGIRNTGAAYSILTNDSLINIGTIAGMGQSLDQNYEGLIMSGKSALIANNYIAQIGYNGINFSKGDSVIVKNNYITNFESVKDDGGGIYSWSGQVDSNTNFYGIQIVRNIIENTSAAPYGVVGTGPSYGSGIYLDENSTGMTISGNSISNCLAGLFIHECRNINITGNTLFNNQAQLFFMHNTTLYATKNNVTTGNIICSKTSTQTNLLLKTINVGIQTFGSFNNNYYNSTINNMYLINANGKGLNLQLWQYLYGKDITSVDIPVVPAWNVVAPNKRTLFGNSAFTTNISGATTTSANGNFLESWDSTSGLDAGTLKTTFSFVSGSPTNNPIISFKVGAVTATNVYMFKFSLKSTHNNRRVMVYLRNNATPYNMVSPLQYLTLDSIRTEITIMMTPSVACPNTAVILQLENEDVTTWVDNLKFLCTNSTPIDPSTQIVYKSNPSTAPYTLKLAGTYYDAKGTKYAGQTLVPAFGSVLLFKRADTVVTAPPVIYAAPNAGNDYKAFSVLPKTNVNIGVYPNPASDYIMLNFNTSSIKDLNIKLLNPAGDIIINRQVQVNDTSYRFELNQKPRPGCYFIQLSGTGISQTSKIIII